MALNGEYEASPWEWVRDQVEEYESSGGEKGNTLRDTGASSRHRDHTR